jgi:hypothetical protein
VIGLFRRFFGRQRSAEAERLRGSFYFNEAWYLNANPDVRAAGVDAALHYVEHGARERRDPGPHFSTAEYLRMNPGVEAAGENPVLHFMRTRREGQAPPLPNYGDAQKSADGGKGELRTASELPIRHGPLVDPARDRELNRIEAAEDPEGLSRSKTAIDAFLAALPVDPSADITQPVPRIFHFVYGFKQGGDIPYYGYMAIRSALHFNPGWSVYYYTMNVPTGPNWDRIKDAVTLIQISDFDYVMNARFHHYAHKADIVRMIAINKVGGVYLDLDTLTRRSFEDLRQHEFVMGVQASGPDSSSGMANAVMMGKPGARFSTRWLAQYDYFRSKGRDGLWDYHSVKMPVEMMTLSPELIHVLDYRAFFYPLWHAVEAHLFTESAFVRFRHEFDTTYCFHLWNGASGPFLETLNEDFVRGSRSIYASIAREVEGFPEPPARPIAGPQGGRARRPAAASKTGGTRPRTARIKA